MGRPPTAAVASGQCARIATGGMLPEGTDAVVMVEHTQAIGGMTIEALRAVAPGENVIQIGEDIQGGDPLLSRGQLLRPQDLGGLLALGVTSVHVARRLRVRIVSACDQLVRRDR